MRRTRPLPVHVYVAVVVTGSVALAAALAATGAWPAVRVTGALLAFGALVIVADFFPIRVDRRSSGGTVTFNTTFAFALLLSAGVTAAVVAQILASLASDIHSRRAWWKTLFNMAQYGLSLGCGGFVLWATGGMPELTSAAPVSPIDLVRILLAAAAVLGANYIVTGGAIALATGEPLLPVLRADLGFNVAIPGVLLTLSPALVVLAQHSFALMAPVLLAVAAFYLGARVSQERGHAALHDALTGLPNRRAFHQRVEEALGERQSAETIAVLLVDLDKFKPINDTLGHHVGDLVLQWVAERLRDQLPPGSMPARLGGDEFAVLLPVPTTPADAAAVAARIRTSLEDGLSVDGQHVVVGASIGCAIGPHDGFEVEDLLRHADAAMYEAKRGGTGVAAYRRVNDAAADLQRLVAELRDTIANGGLRLDYQPIVEMAGGRVVGAEALVRWQHPDRGLLSPDEFIPIAERADLILDLTRTVLDRALAQCASWHRSGYYVSVAVNVPARCLDDAEFPAMVSRLLREHRLAGPWLTLELNERTVMENPARIADRLAELDAMGVNLAIDDFGSGAISVTDLKRLPVHEVKVDRAFVSSLGLDARDDVIVPALVDLVHKLGLRAVAEGVETEDAWTRLRAMGCDLAQGYHLSTPQSAEVVTAWLAERLDHLAVVEQPCF